MHMTHQIASCHHPYHEGVTTKLLVSKYGLYGQPCHKGFTAQNTRFLQILFIALPCGNRKSKGKRGKTQMMEGIVITEQEETERNRKPMINDTISVDTCSHRTPSTINR